MLPIEQILPQLQQQLVSGDAIVVAPPGAGKSTHLPLSLLKSALFQQQKIIMLQPRRIAVRNIARYLAEQLGEAVGQTVGYRIRGESKVSANTRLEIVTEGILTRMLQQQPELPGIGLIIFDEFHERSIHADFSLALCIEVQQGLRDDLRLLVMSATIDTQSLSQLLPQAQILESKGRSFPVELVYRPDTSRQPLADKISRLILEVLPLHQQDMLVFLPGAGDIKKVADKLNSALGSKLAIHSLYGELPKEQQQAALLPDNSGKRKIVLATNIAETSLTIEGIEVVVDSGIEKTALFQLNRGITHLQSQAISQASATQRAGRAGRLGPGTCYRLWSSEQQQRMSAQATPEILQSDMAGLVLETAIWGTQVSDLALIDKPTSAQLRQAEQYLHGLGMLDEALKLTALGRQVHALGCHPSIANMLLQSAKLSKHHLSMACAIAGLMESKDPLNYQAGAMLSARLTYLQHHRQHSIWQQIKQWYNKLNSDYCEWPLEDVAIVLAYGFGQWIAKTRQNSRYLLANGSGAVLADSDPLTGQEWLVVAAMMTTDKQQDDAQIRYAEALSLQQIKQHFASSLRREDMVQWDNNQQRISASRQTKLGSIVLQKEAMDKPSAIQISAIWQQVILQKGMAALPFNDACISLQHRCRLARQLLTQDEWPDLSETALLKNLATWLLPYTETMMTWSELAKLDFYTLLKNLFDWQQWNKLETLLPTQLTVASGRAHKLEYGEHGSVTLAVRMQELYGTQVHPAVAHGKILVTIELLSPASRPLQTTQDLPGFWQGSYKQVQKEMKGRYPRHFWPDEPAKSPATTTTKKNMTLPQ
ncbi:ATP-dependent helicase [Paraglaciecola hydrolytica]|uniref:ATP-dependent helicase n=1 Tax=Paraglaciecola hydrolytica TaxID=1799789 RepID=A0A136A2P3_9ALTE|nr:ATP-dependent helicase [Paraglaciecola hydrolytica]